MVVAFQWRKASLALLIAVSMAIAGLPAAADLSDDIETSTQEDSKPQGEESAIDVATADFNEIADQLRALNREVNEATAARKRLETERKQSENSSDDLLKEIEEMETKIQELAVELGDKAVSAFQDQGLRSPALVADDNPNDAARRRKLSNVATKSEVETAEELRQTRADLAAKKEARGQLSEKLDEDAKKTSANVEKFTTARETVARLAEDAEERADRILSEAEAVGQLDKEKADELRKSVKALNEQVRLALGPKVKKAEEDAKANPDAAAPPSSTERAQKGDMRQVQGIWVHKEIADRVDALLNAARADGIVLSGGGFRDPAAQIAVRKSNCGTSNYAIYQQPASSCSPPTARPGTSMHEQGKAIDFTYQGRIIGSRSSTAFVWLNANAGKYGLQNLPSEPWHWSTNGR